MTRDELAAIETSSQTQNFQRMGANRIPVFQAFSTENEASNHHPDIPMNLLKSITTLNHAQNASPQSHHW